MLRIAPALILVLAFLVGFGSRTEASSRVLVVNAIDDLNDGSCDAQHCSFREALIRAAATPTGDRMVFDRHVFPRDVPVVIHFFGPSMGSGSWFVPDDTEIDGSGSDVILQGPEATLALGSRTLVHGLSISGGSSAGYTTFYSIVTLGDENTLSDNTLIGGVGIHSDCGGGDQAQGNRLLHNEIVGGVDLRGGTCGVEGTVLKFNYISDGLVGAMLWNTSNTTITANTFSGNRYGIELEVQTSDLKITRNNIAGNTDYGLIYAGAGPDILDVEHNWWGSTDGPSGDGFGTGDRIWGSRLDYEPWSRHPIHN